MNVKPDNIFDFFYFRSELNLGGSRAGFTIIKYHSPKKEEKFMVKVCCQGGAVRVELRSNN